MLKIQKQLNQHDDTSVIGPKYNEKYKAFFKKAEDEFIASAGTPNTKTIERLANEYVNILDADPEHRDQNYRILKRRLNPLLIHQSFASIGYNSMKKLLPPEPKSIDLKMYNKASEVDMNKLSKYQQIYYLYCSNSKNLEKVISVIIKFTRHKSFLKDGFLDNKGHFTSLEKIISSRTSEIRYYETREEAEIASIQNKAYYESQNTYSTIWKKTWKKYEEILNYREEILSLTRYFTNDPTHLKGKNKEQVFDVVQSEIKNYKVFLEYIAKYDLATRLQQRIYLGEGISIDNFFSKDAEIQLPLKLIYPYIAKILTEK